VRKKILLISTIAIAALFIGGTAVLAYSNFSLRERLQDSTGMTDATLDTELNSGKRLGQIAKGNGANDEFHDAMLEEQREAVEARVEDGSLTQEEADTLLGHFEAAEYCTDEASCSEVSDLNSSGYDENRRQTAGFSGCGRR